MHACGCRCSCGHARQLEGQEVQRQELGRSVCKPVTGHIHIVCIYKYRYKYVSY